MKNPASNAIVSIATIIIAVVFLVFPVFFLTATTDFFTFPKQILVIGAALILFLLYGIKSILDRKVSLLVNPLNIPVLIFCAALILSTIFSVSRFDAVLQSVPVILLGVFFFTTINFIQEKSSFIIVITCLIVGTVISALISILSFFNIYILPFAEAKSVNFNTFGSPVQYGAFLLPILVMCSASLFMLLKKHKVKAITSSANNLLQFIAAIIFAAGLGILIFQIIKAPQKPILLPFNHGFQIAFASISQDATRMAQSLLFGSGYGTFSIDFGRFVSSAFNSYPFWSLTFAFSSSYILELLATTGILGVIGIAFMFTNFIRSKAKPSNPLFLAVITIFALSLLIPFSYALVFLMFALLSLFVAHRGIENAKGFENITINLVALQQGLIAMHEEHSTKNKGSLFFPTILLLIGLIGSFYILFYLVGSGTAPRKGYAQLISADMKFARSLSAKALESGQETYQLQTSALNEYPYRSDYYRIYSQINLALAANLVAAQNGNQPGQEVQNQIVGLLQQSINSARQAVTFSQYSSLNWQNLGQIYRNLIGVGENAERFAVESYGQAILLNPANPGLKIELGGIYYQLQQWEQAQNQFSQAVQNKADYANAYYNLGHVFEEKGDLQSALSQYEIVKQLVINDKANLDKIEGEIKSVKDKIGAQANQQNQGQINPTTDETPLKVNTPQTEFPEKNPREKIPAPPKGQPTPTPTAGAESSTTVTPASSQ